MINTIANKVAIHPRRKDKAGCDVRKGKINFILEISFQIFLRSLRQEAENGAKINKFK